MTPEQIKALEDKYRDRLRNEAREDFACIIGREYKGTINVPNDPVVIAILFAAHRIADALETIEVVKG